jgi:phage repressor protein C with HTH and peptisase S24 domain
MPTHDETLREAQRALVRDAAGLCEWTPTELARAAKLAPSTFNRFLGSDVAHLLSTRSISKLLDAADRRVTELSADRIKAKALAGRWARINQTYQGALPQPPKTAGSTVPLVGYVGAGAAIHPFDDHEKGSGLDDVDAPPGHNGAMVAVQVRGDSMYPAYHEGDLIFYARTTTGVIPELCVGHECVVEVENGPTLVKQVERGSRAGRFTLVSYNAAPMVDVKLAWATPVAWIDKRRRHSKKAAQAAQKMTAEAHRRKS